MSLDIDRLRAGLEEYRSVLERQREQTRENVNELQQLFDALWSEYGGRMAEDFQHNWGRTAEWLEQYIEAERRLDRFLSERIEQLHHL